VQDFDLAAKKARINIKNDPKLKIRRGMSFVTSLLTFVGIVYGSYLIICWRVENDIVSDEVQAIDASLGHEEEEKDLIAVETITKMTRLREEEEKARKAAEEAAAAAAATEQNKSAAQAAPVHPSLYWQYIGTNIDTVNFTSLRKTNPQTKAWIIVKGTNINYPVVQASDNSFYLSHSYTGTLNSSGWVFMDYEDDPNFGSQNTVIYAHGRNEGTMFGTLKNALNANWQNNPDNHVVVTATEKNIFFWKVFSVYRIPNTNDYITVNYKSKNNFQRFIDTVKGRSVYNFNTNVSADNRVLTLSTCIGSGDRMVLHAVLIETVNK